MNEPQVYLGTAANGDRFQLPLSAFRLGSQTIGPPNCGKTYHEMNVAEQLARLEPRVCQMHFDGKGDLFDGRRRFYGRAMDRRLVIVDPGRADRITGLDFMHPWPGEEERQANLGADLFLRSLGQTDPFVTTRMLRWITNVYHASLVAGLKAADAREILDYTDGSFRTALIDRLPPSAARNDFVWLSKVTGERTAMKVADEHLGPALGRFRALTANPRLRLMLGTDRALDWGRVIREGRLVFFNFSREAMGFNDQRLFMLAVLNEVIYVTFKMGPTDRVRLYLFIDEAGLARGPELEELIDRGRSFGVSVHVAHQGCSQFVDPQTHDRRTLDSVLRLPLKFVFGRLTVEDADEMARVIWGHHLDPDRRRVVSRSPRQLQQVITARSRTVGRSRTDGRFAARGRSHTSGLTFTESDGEVRVAGSSGSIADSQTLPIDPAEGMGTAGLVTTASHDASTAVSANHGLSESQVDAESEVEGMTAAKTRSFSETEGPMVVPGPVFLESQVEFEPLETQAWRHQSALIRQPDRHTTCAQLPGRPEAFRTADLPAPRISPAQASILDRRVMDRQPEWCATTESVVAEIADRHRRLLGPGSNAEVVQDAFPTPEELKRNLTAAMPIAPGHTKTRRPRGGR